MFRDVAPLQPMHFLEVATTCGYSDEESIGKKRYLLPDTSSYFLSSSSFAKVYMAYREDAILFQIGMEGSIYRGEDPMQECIEIFLDTRGQANRKYAGPFSHHFLLTFQPFEGSYIREISRFSGESHPLCNPTDLEVEFEKKMSSFVTYLKIPSFCLHGYMPKEHPNWRFTYKIQRADNRVQYFSCTDEEVNIWQNSYLWAEIAPR